MDGEIADKTEPLDDDALLQEINSRWKDASRAREQWTKEATESYGFVSGSGQWDEQDEQSLKDQDRPVVTFNRVGPVVDVIAGLEVGNRQEIRYLPREKGDVRPNEILTAAAKWVRDECNAEDEESSAFVDMVITGEGWVNTRLDYEYDLDGAIVMERVDGREIYPDPDAKRSNYIDMEYVFCVKDVATEWVKSKWPDKADELTFETSSEDSPEAVIEHFQTKKDQYALNQGARGNYKKTVRLFEYQYKKRKAVVRVQDPFDGKLKKVSPAEFKKLQIAVPGIKGVNQTECAYWRVFKVGETILENLPCSDPGSFSYKAMTAKRDNAKGDWYGIVRGTKDPQRWANKWLAQSMHILNSNAKGGLVIENSALNGVKASTFEASWSDPSKVSVVADGALSGGRIQPKQPPAFPPQLSELMTFAIGSIRDVSGVSVELLGVADRQQAASLELQRKQAGVTILATFFDSLRRYRKQQGKSLLYLIMNYISDSRLIRVVGKGQEQYVPLIKQDGIVEFDVIVDEAPTSPNMKERTWAILQQIIPMALQAGLPIPSEVLDYLPLPQSLIDAMQKPKEPDPKAMEAEALAKRGQEAEIGKTEAEAAKAKAEAMTAGRQAQPQPTQRDQIDTINALAKTDNQVAQNLAAGIPPGISTQYGPRGLN